MNKKTIIIIISAIIISALITAGTIFLFLNKLEQQENQPEIIEEIDLNKIDYEQLQYLAMDSLTIQVAPTENSSKSNYLLVEFGMYVTDAEMLARVQALNSRIKDVVIGVFESKKVSELEGNRELMKQVLLDNIREIFVKEGDKEKIVDVAITKYMIAQQ